MSNLCPTQIQLPRNTRGFSMVELLVAMTISLIGMIIIFQVFEVSENIKRTTTSGGASTGTSTSTSTRSRAQCINDCLSNGTRILNRDNHTLVCTNSVKTR